MRNQFRFARCDLRPLQTPQARALFETILQNATIVIPLSGVAESADDFSALLRERLPAASSATRDEPAPIQTIPTPTRDES